MAAAAAAPVVVLSIDVGLRNTGVALVSNNPAVIPDETVAGWRGFAAEAERPARSRLAPRERRLQAPMASGTNAEAPFVILDTLLLDFVAPGADARTTSLNEFVRNTASTLARTPRITAMLAVATHVVIEDQAAATDTVRAVGAAIQAYFHTVAAHGLMPACRGIGMISGTHKFNVLHLDAAGRTSSGALVMEPRPQGQTSAQRHAYNKKLSIAIAKYILAFYGMTDMLAVIEALPKKDDITDSIDQALAVLRDPTTRPTQL